MRYLKRNLTIAVAASAICAILPNFAIAQEANSETIIVTATRTPKSLKDITAPLSVISAKDIQTNQSESYVDLLQRLPGVDFYGGPRVQGEMPNIRGATGRQVVILVDGARQNASPSLSSPLYLEQAFLSRVEVLKGASSSLYGQGGLGGTLLFKTLEVSDLLGKDKNLGGDIKGIYQSANEKQQLIGKFYAKTGSLDFFAGASAGNWGPTRQGGGTTLLPGKGNSTAALGKATWHINEGLSAQISHSYYDLEDMQPNNPQASNDFPFVQNNWATDKQTILKISDKGNFNFSIYHNDLLTGADPRNDVTPALTSSSVSTKTTGFTGDSNWKFNLFGIANQVTIGGDGYKDKLVSRSNGLPNGVTPDGEQQSLGIFINDEIKLLPWLSFTPAVRYDKFETSVNSGIAPKKTDDSTSPQATLALSIIPNTVVYASYGEAFRAPTVYEMYQSFNVATGFSNFVPNTGLKSETSNETNIGLNFRKAEIGILKYVSFKADAFQADVDNLITSVTVGTFYNPVLKTNRPILQYQNISQARRKGIEIDAKANILGFNMGIGYSNVRVTDRIKGDNLFSPPDKITLTIDKNLIGGAMIKWRSMWVSAQDYDTTIIRRRPSYNVHDLLLSWEVEGTNLRADFGVTNLFDERYAGYKQSTAYPNVYEQGRSLRLALGYKF